MVGLPDQLSYRKTVEYLKQNEGFELIASEVDLDSLKEELLSEEDGGIDTLYLAVF